jgi:hypothetical protein
MYASEVTRRRITGVIQEDYAGLGGNSLSHHWSPKPDPKKPPQHGVRPRHPSGGFFFACTKQMPGLTQKRRRPSMHEEASEPRDTAGPNAHSATSIPATNVTLSGKGRWRDVRFIPSVSCD